MILFMRLLEVKEMTEFAKSFVMMVGTITTALVITYFVLKLEEKFKSWRKNGCKFKCLCKHEYDVEFANSLFGEIQLKCRKCEKKKIIKNLSSELVDKLW